MAFWRRENLVTRRVGPVEASAISIPATAFSGDFYALLEAGDALWFALGDFAGHGLNAAIFSAMIHEELERLVHSCSSADPAEVVAGLDAMLRHEAPRNRFATLVAGRIAPDRGLQLVTAGHEPPLIVRDDGSVTSLTLAGPLVGLLPDPRWASCRLALTRGERLLLFSDGVPEARNAAGEEFGLERISRAAAGSKDAIVPLLESLSAFAAAPLHDDATLLQLRLL